MVIAICEGIRWFFESYRKKMGMVDKVVPCISILLCLTGYCLYVLENCIKYISKNAYIQIALANTSFCPSAFNAFVLVIRNVKRFAVAGGIGRVFMLFGGILISSATCLITYFIVSN